MIVRVLGAEPADADQVPSEVLGVRLGAAPGQELMQMPRQAR